MLQAATNADPNPSKNLGTIALSEGSALLAEAGPSGTPTDLLSTPQNGRISLYVVRAGDTLSDISKMFGVSINTVAWANNLGTTRDIHPGQMLVILPVSGVEHTVKKGDTLVSIAKKYAADSADIADFNGLDASATLEIGSTVIVPGGELAPVPATKKVIPSSTYRGGGGAFIAGYYANPVPGAILTQNIHGWNGVDLGAAKGTSVRASADGTVIVSRTSGWNGGYGIYVVITHDNGTQTLYSHLSSNIASVGQAVSQGQVIGYVGSTGQSTGSHLHFEVRGAKNPFAACRAGSVCSPQ